MLRKTVLPFGLFILVVLACFAGVFRLGRLPVQRVEGAPGSADLRGVDFDGRVAETSSWLALPGVLAAPGAAAEPGEAGAAYGTLRLSLLLPEGEYIMGFNSVMFAQTLFINGEEADRVGSVSSSEAGFVPGRAHRYYVVRPQNGRLELQLHHANFYDAGSGAPTLAIGRATPMFNYQVHADFTRFTVMAVYLMAFILYFGMYMFQRGARENLWFSITCLVLTLRESFIGDQFLFTLIEGLPMGLVFVVQYVTIGLLVILLFTFIFTLFPSLMCRGSARAFYIACASFVVVSLITRSYLPHLQLYVYLGIGAFIMLYILLHLARGFGAMPADKRLAAIGIFILFLGLFNDMFHLLGLVVGPVGRRAMLQSVMLVFIFIQTVALFLRFMSVERQLGETREKQAALAAQNATLQMVDRQRVQFLAHVSHELKTPLTVVSNYAQLTRQREEAGPDADAYVVQKMLLVASEAERMAMMVEQVLDIARIEEGRMNYHFGPTDIEALVADMVNVYYPVLNKNHNTLHVDIPPGLPPVHADEGRLGQVLVNLVNNALRFTKRGTVTIKARQQGGTLLLTVQDTGIGMAPEQLARLFERYNTSEALENQRAGTGLGLYITREIVRAHGGSIGVESSPAAGTAVTVSLPLAGPPPSADTREEEADGGQNDIDD